jgi:hypothetical protein
MNTLVDPARDKWPYDADIVPHRRRSSAQKSALAIRSRPPTFAEQEKRQAAPLPTRNVPGRKLA